MAWSAFGADPAQRRASGSKSGTTIFALSEIGEPSRGRHHRLVLGRNAGLLPGVSRTLTAAFLVAYV